MDLAEIKKFESKVGVIKLSEAIRIGSKLRPQGHGDALTQWANGTSCALLAGYEALHGWPKTKFQALDCYTIGKRELTDVIWKKNDAEHMTREQIADWLESQGL